MNVIPFPNHNRPLFFCVDRSWWKEKFVRGNPDDYFIIYRYDGEIQASFGPFTGPEAREFAAQISHGTNHHLAVDWSTFPSIDCEVSA
jgi:hypothetical protein